MNIEDIFMAEELRTAAAMPITDEILVAACRAGTQAFFEFANVHMLPQVNGVMHLKPSDRETAVAICFYRLLGAVRTLNDLRAGYQFQTQASCTRLIFELCVDVGLLCGSNPIERGVEKFHGFTRAHGSRWRARLSSSIDSIRSSKIPATRKSGARSSRHLKGRRRSPRCAGICGVSLRRRSIGAA